MSSHFDVIVVGGGIIGASVALELSAQDVNVALIDGQQPGREASWAAAGMLSPGPDSPAALPLVSLAKESLRLYPNFVAAVEETSGASVSFRREGAFEVFVGPGAKSRRDELLAEYAALGLCAESVSLESARQIEPSLNAEACAAAWLPDEGSVDPRLLVDATLAALKIRGVTIISGPRVTSVVSNAGRCTGVIAGDQKISGGQVVIAAGSFCSGIAGAAADSSIDLSRYAPTHPVKGQMLALRAPQVTLRKVLRSADGYIVPRADGRIIAGSTLEDVGFSKGTTPEGLRKIREAAIALAPGLAAAQIVETWSGLRPGTPDQLPIIGPTDVPGLLIATGHYRNGILLAPATAKLIRAWIVDGKTDFKAEKFSPLRFLNSMSRSAAQKSVPASS